MPTINEINFKVNVTYGDTSLSDQTTPEAKLMMFILWGVILPLVATAGLVGNILTIIVLWRREMHSTTILYLRGLVITDTGILIGSVITLTPISCANYLHGNTLEYIRDVVYPVIHTPGYYIMMTLQQCNVWITVSVSMERYIAICHPFRAARLITRRKTIIVLVSIIVISFVYNIPHLFATTTKHCSAQHPLLPQRQETKLNIVTNGGGDYGLNSSSMTFTRPVTQPTTLPSIAPEVQCLVLADTEFSATQFFTFYRTLLYSIIIYIIPFLALLVLNIFLIKELMVMQKRRSGTSIHEENEANLSLVLVLIVVVFIFCQTPGLVSQFDIIPVHIFVYWFTVSNFLFSVNSAVNFLIYTAFGRKFRRVLLRVFRHLFKKNRRQSQSSFRMTQYTDADFDTCDRTETHNTPLCGVSCYKSEVKSVDDTNENVPLNTTNHTTTTNGYTSSSNCNNGVERMTPVRMGEDGKLDNASGCETMDSSAILPEDKYNLPVNNHDDTHQTVTVTNNGSYK